MMRSSPGTSPVQSLVAFAERLDGQRPDQRSEHRAGAADDRRQQRLDRDPGAIGDAGIHEEEILRVEAAGGRRDGGRDDHGAELDRSHVDAERPGRVFVLAHSDQPGAEARALEASRDRKRRHADKRQDDQIERRSALELERLRARVELDQNADAGAGDRARRWRGCAALRRTRA